MGKPDKEIVAFFKALAITMVEGNPLSLGASQEEINKKAVDLLEEFARTTEYEDWKPAYKAAAKQLSM